MQMRCQCFYSAALVNSKLDYLFDHQNINSLCLHNQFCLSEQIMLVLHLLQRDKEVQYSIHLGVFLQGDFYWYVNVIGGKQVADPDGLFPLRIADIVNF